MTSTLLLSVRLILIIVTVDQISCLEYGYLRYVKDGCFLRGEAMSCVKYKALKLATKTIFGDSNSNETIKANYMISFVPLDEEAIKNFTVNDEKEPLLDEPRSMFSEWTQLAKYFMSLVKNFMKLKGMRVELPDGARTIEEDNINDDGRGRRKKLAVVVPVLTLLATLKTKLLLIPILLAVLLIKKLLLVAALLLPSLLNTLKHCKHHPMSHHSYFGSNDNSEFNSDYSTYSSGGGYGKDWASNRAYLTPKHRPPSPMYMTAPGGVST